MKTQIVARMSKKYFLSNLPGFQQKGFLIYRQDFQYLLQGFCFDGSAFNRNSFTIDVFVHPLFIPSEDIDLSFGNRIGIMAGKNDIWWQYDEMREVEIAQEIFDMMKNHGLPFLEETATIEGFLKRYKDADIHKNKHIIEGLCYAHILNDDFSKSQKMMRLLSIVLTQDINEFPVVWKQEIQQRIQLMLGYLDRTEYDRAKQQLSDWRHFTLANLGL